MLRFQLLDSERGCLYRRGGQRLEKDVRQRMVDSETADVETLFAVAAVEFLALTVIPGRGIRALIGDTQSSAAVPTESQALQQCGSFSQRVTCLVEFSWDVRLEALLNGFKGGPVDETFMVSAKKHRPLFPGR